MTSQYDEIYIAVSLRLNHALGSRSEAAIIKLDVVKATRWHRNAIDQITVRAKPLILLTILAVPSIVEHTPYRVPMTRPCTIHISDKYRRSNDHRLIVHRQNRYKQRFSVYQR